MKRNISLVLIFALVLTLLTGCGSSGDSLPAQEMPGSAVEILNKIWADYAEDEKFFVMGGNMENVVDNAPGEYNLEYAENMTYNLLVPAEQISNIKEAASMIHAMNANSFTCGVFRLADGVKAADFGETMRQSIQGNQWMCGFPDKLEIRAFGDTYVLAAFGVNDAMDPFIAHMDAVYPGFTIIASESVG